MADPGFCEGPNKRGDAKWPKSDRPSPKNGLNWIVLLLIMGRETEKSSTHFNPLEFRGNYSAIPDSLGSINLVLIKTSYKGFFCTPRSAKDFAAVKGAGKPSYAFHRPILSG